MHPAHCTEHQHPQPHTQRLPGFTTQPLSLHSSGSSQSAASIRLSRSEVKGSKCLCAPADALRMGCEQAEHAVLHQATAFGVHSHPVWLLEATQAQQESCRRAEMGPGATHHCLWAPQHHSSELLSHHGASGPPGPQDSSLLLSSRQPKEMGRHVGKIDELSTKGKEYGELSVLTLLCSH